MDIAEVKVPKKEAADGNEEEAAVYEDGKSEEKCPQRLINAIGQSSESVTVESQKEKRRSEREKLK